MMREYHSRRLVRVPVSHELIIEILREGYSTPGPLLVERGLPQDAVFVGTFYVQEELTVHFVFYHESFDEVPVAGVIPVFYPKIVVSTKDALEDARKWKKLWKLKATYWRKKYNEHLGTNWASDEYLWSRMFEHD